MVQSKDALSFANTSYVLEAIQQKCQNELAKKEEVKEEAISPEPAGVDKDEMSSWRRERLAAIKRMKAKSREYLDQGHGTLETVNEEKEVINVCNTHKRVIVHFYKDEFARCKLLDGLLTSLAAKHLETKFIRMSAIKSPFFTKKLGMQALPTVIFTLDGILSHVFTGFEEFKRDKITEEALRSGLLAQGAITTECCEDLQEAHSEDSE